MSTPSGAGPSDNRDAKDDRRKSLGKYVKRMSSVFRRDKPAKTKPVAPSTATATTTAAAPSAAIAEQDNKETATAYAPADNNSFTFSPTNSPYSPTTTTTPAPEPPRALTTLPTTQQLNRSQLQQERARALFEKYGLVLESHEWISTADPTVNVQRVEKPIRMRVHRSCHHCGTTYTGDKVCAKCDHKRCKKCPRYPKKKTPAETSPEDEKKPRKKKMLTLTSKTGSELVYQPTKQRVRRTCHRCNSMFIPATAVKCDHCGHNRCTKCPRQPSKLDKWPNGYPGDESASETEYEQEMESKRTWRRPRTRVRWECEQCHSLFVEGSSQCSACGHGKCDNCLRKPYRRLCLLSIRECFGHFLMIGSIDG